MHDNKGDQSKATTEGSKSHRSTFHVSAINYSIRVVRRTVPSCVDKAGSRRCNRFEGKLRGERGRQVFKRVA